MRGHLVTDSRRKPIQGYGSRDYSLRPRYAPRVLHDATARPARGSATLRIAQSTSNEEVGEDEDKIDGKHRASRIGFTGNHEINSQGRAQYELPDVRLADEASTKWCAGLRSISRFARWFTCKKWKFTYIVPGEHSRWHDDDGCPRAGEPLWMVVIAGSMRSHIHSSRVTSNDLFIRRTARLRSLLDSFSSRRDALSTRGSARVTMSAGQRTAFDEALAAAVVDRPRRARVSTRGGANAGASRRQAEVPWDFSFNSDTNTEGRSIDNFCDSFITPRLSSLENLAIALSQVRERNC